MNPREIERDSERDVGVDWTGQKQFQWGKKNSVHLQMKLVHSNFASLLLFLLRWMDLSCSCLLPHYFNLVHVLVYKLTTHGRKATISEFYGKQTCNRNCIML